MSSSLIGLHQRSYGLHLHKISKGDFVNVTKVPKDVPHHTPPNNCCYVANVPKNGNPQSSHYLRFCKCQSRYIYKYNRKPFSTLNLKFLKPRPKALHGMESTMLSTAVHPQASQNMSVPRHGHHLCVRQERPT